MKTEQKKKIISFPNQNKVNLNRNELILVINEWKLAILTISDAITNAAMTNEQFDDACRDLERSLENYREWKQALKQL